MDYLTRDELRRLFKAAYDNNKLHHQCLLAMFWNGLRISEAMAIRGIDICDGKLTVRRLKKSRPTVHSLKVDSDPVFDQSPLLEIAKTNPGRLFNFSRQRADEFIRRYAQMARLRAVHCHMLKHSICVLLYQQTHDINAVQDFVGHRAQSSSLIYIRAEAGEKAQAA